jgi:UDP-N-acetylglucosamine:LPS N-acetylglucosamine transferase
MKAKKDWEKTKGLGTNQQAQARTNKRMGGPKICTITQGPSSFEYRKEKEKRHFNYYLLFSKQCSSKRCHPRKAPSGEA